MTHERHRINAARRRLPMVRLENPYHFEATGGPKTLADLFEGRLHLVTYHFMFDSAWEDGCP